MANAALTAAETGAAASSSFPARALQAVTSRLVILVPYLWLLFFFLVPFVIVFKISLSTTAIAMPPYTPALGLDEGVGAGRGVATGQELDLDGEHQSPDASDADASSRLFFTRSASFGDGESVASGTPAPCSNFTPSGSAATASP